MSEHDTPEPDLAPHLVRAADRFGVKLVGPPSFGWGGRSLGSRAVGTGGEERWVRVVSEHLDWVDDPFWTGNQDASMITGVPKPVVLDAREYREHDRCFRTELMTRAAGEPCSATPELRSPPPVSGRWWQSLRDGIGVVTRTATSRVCVTQDDVTRRLRVFWGDAIDPTVERWSTAHGDLHWANLLHPELSIVDWEGWGSAPAGYDAATLHAYSLLVPSVAEQIEKIFQSDLETPDGRRAELYAIARLLLRTEYGDHPDLAIPLHHRAARIIAAIGQEK